MRLDESERVASGQKVACDATLGWSSARASSTSLCAPPAPSEDSPCQCEMYRSRRGRSGGGATQMPPYQRPLSSLRSWVRTKARRQRRQRRRTRTQPTRSMTELFLSPTTTKRGGVTRVTRVEGAPVGRVEGTCRKSRTSRATRQRRKKKAVRSASCQQLVNRRRSSPQVSSTKDYESNEDGPLYRGTMSLLSLHRRHDAAP